MKMKRLLSILLCLSLLIGACSTSLCVGAMDFIEEENYFASRDGLYYCLVNSDGSSCSIDTYLGENPIVSVPASIDGYAVTGLSVNAFNGLSVTSVSLPASITEIDSYAFDHADSITSLTVDEANTVYYSKDNCIITREGGVLVTGCTTSVIPSDASIQAIGDSAFYGKSSATVITVPNGVERLESYAFGCCDNLEELYIPASVTYLGMHLVDACPNLSTIHYGGTAEQWDAIEKDEMWMCSNDHVFSVVCSDGAEILIDSIDVDPFDNETLAEIFCDRLFRLNGYYDFDASYVVATLIDALWVDYGHEDWMESFEVPENVVHETIDAYFALSDQMRSSVYSLLPYDEVTGMFTLENGGGFGGFLSPRCYHGFVQYGEEYIVYYRNITYSYLYDDMGEDADAYCEALGYPEVVVYNGLKYCPGPDGYYAVLSYDDFGMMYTVTYDNGIVRLIDAKEYTAQDLPEVFDHESLPERTSRIVRGDANDDGKIGSDDAIYLLRSILMPEQFPLIQSADVDGNGDVNSNDALYLLRHTLLPERFPLMNA